MTSFVSQAAVVLLPSLTREGLILLLLTKCSHGDSDCLNKKTLMRQWQWDDPHSNVAASFSFHFLCTDSHFWWHRPCPQIKAVLHLGVRRPVDVKK